MFKEKSMLQFNSVPIGKTKVVSSLPNISHALSESEYETSNSPLRYLLLCGLRRKCARTGYRRSAFAKAKKHFGHICLMVTDVFSVADLAATDIGCWQVFVCIRLFEDDLKRLQIGTAVYRSRQIGKLQ